MGGWLVGKSDFNENPVVSPDLDLDFGLRLRVCQFNSDHIKPVMASRPHGRGYCLCLWNSDACPLIVQSVCVGCHFHAFGHAFDPKYIFISGMEQVDGWIVYD